MYLSKSWIQELNAPLANLLSIPKWEVLLILLRDRGRYKSEPDRLELWTLINGMEFNKLKCLDVIPRSK